jgi:acetyl-CoA synthetase
VALREICSSGEPLNADVIEKVRRAWGLTLRDGYGQTETTMMVGNPPGQKLVVGAMGRPLPGYRVVLLDVEGLESDYGEISLPLSAQPLGLTPGYLDDDGALEAIEGEHYRTGDIASRDGEGFLTYVGRVDDLFKSSDYRLSPFELESALLEHPLVAEAAVTPARDPIRMTVPKAYVTLAKSEDGDRAVALSVFTFLRDRLAPYKRIRRIEFVVELPKTMSGKIRRVALRQREAELAEVGARAEREFRIEDFPELA